MEQTKQEQLLTEIKAAPVFYAIALIFRYLAIGPLWIMIAYALIYMIFPAPLQMMGLSPTIGWVDAFYLNIARAFLVDDIFGLRFYHMLQTSKRIRYLMGK